MRWALFNEGVQGGNPIERLLMSRKDHSFIPMCWLCCTLYNTEANFYLAIATSLHEVHSFGAVRVNTVPPSLIRCIKYNETAN